MLVTIAIICLVIFVILFYVALSEKEYGFAFICFIITIICLAYLFNNMFPNVRMKHNTSKRETYYTNLVLARDSGIKDPYVKEIINNAIEKIYTSNKKEKVLIAVPQDFYSLSRKKEYDEVIKIIKSSGFKIEPEVKECVYISFGEDKCHLTNQIEVW